MNNPKFFQAFVGLLTFVIFECIALPRLKAELGPFAHGALVILFGLGILLCILQILWLYKDVFKK